MVAVRMRAQDRAHPLALGRGQDRRQMLGQIGPGIDYRHLAPADDIGLRTGIGERRRIGRQQAAHQRLQRDGQDRHQAALEESVRPE